VNCKRATEGLLHYGLGVSSADVCAVVYADTPDQTAADVLQAARSQSVPPRVVLAASFEAGKRQSAFAAGAADPRAQGCRWLWLLDGYAVPEPTALEALLAARQRATEPSPLLLASKVLDPQGRLHPDSTPRHEILEKSHSIDAAERQMVQLRAAAHGSVLVAREALDRFGLPRSDLPSGPDMHEWSARILRGRQDIGYLVPASVAVREAPPRADSWRCLLARVQVLGSGAWEPRERLWEAFLLGADAARALRGDGPQGRDGVGAPGFSPSRRPRRTIGKVRGANRLKRR
jgi:hypothetical protein